jgi:hypothetical protein
MPTKPLAIDSLELDLENPRITLATDQRDAMQKILNEQKIKLINLAESVAVRGLNPMDRFLVLKSSRQDKFIVIEGNRRIFVIKLLDNASLIDDLEMPETVRYVPRPGPVERLYPPESFPYPYTSRIPTYFR